MPTQDEWNDYDNTAMVLDTALNLIGQPDKTDNDLAKVIVENEMAIRRLIVFVLEESTTAAQ